MQPLVLLWSLAVAPIALAAHPREPFPICAKCLPDSIFYAPGIGFDLTHSYGASVAHLSDGSIVNLGQVAASPKYIAWVARLVDAPNPPPLTSVEKWQRSWNKLLGRPASPEAGILAELLAALRDETHSALSPLLGSSFRVESVVVTRPPLTGLRKEDWRDALQHVGLRSWLDPPQPGQAGMYPEGLNEFHASVAADGTGLCANYRDLFVCWAEQEHMSSQLVLTASFSRRAIYVAAGAVRAPFHWIQPQFAYATDLGAGMDSLDDYPTPDEFWARVKGHLRDIGQNALAREPMGLTKVTLLGENATNPEFLNSLRDVLAELAGPGSAAHLEIQEPGLPDPVFQAARGAAMYARRRQEAPFGCREPSRCEEDRRQREKEDTFVKEHAEDL